MADDDIIVNFEIGSGPFDVKPTFKGGSWRDRLKAKRRALHASGSPVQHEDSKTKTGSSNQLSPQSITLRRDDQGRPVKKRRLSSETQNSSRPVTQRTKREQKPEGNAPTEPASRQVVSSLFTFNPSPNVATENPPQESQEAAEPSNAPLKDQLHTFTSLGVTPHIAEHLLKKLEIKAPTSIQKGAIAQLLKEDTDAFIQAETGSGKTLAYLLPIVQRLMMLKPGGTSTEGVQNGDSIHRDSGLFALILAPTRELGKQIAVVLESLLRCAHWIVSGTVIGGEKKKSEKARLRKGLNVLIATPGRLADHLDNTKVLDLKKVRWLVLDEGDRLMELGFEQDIRKILSELDARISAENDIIGLPAQRTTILCSATMKTNVERLGELSLKDAAHVQATEKEVSRNGVKSVSEEAAFSAPAQLQQSYAIVPAKQRLVSLAAVLKRAFARKGSIKKAMVFLSCADSVDFHFDVFSKQDEQPAEQQASDQNGSSHPSDTFRTRGPFATNLTAKNTVVSVFRLHGSLPQPVRTSTLAAFSRSKEPCILLCTDVASRGLDLPNVDLVIEFDPPFTKDDHLHRIGRTARAGRDGRALLFLLPGAEEGYLPILKALHVGRDANIARTPIHHDAEELLRKGFEGDDKKKADWEAEATEWQLNVERSVLEDPKALELARKAYQSHVRAYATHSAAERSVFDLGSLHLGHIAKAFALRDRPGNMKVPGLSSSGDRGNKRRGEKNAVGVTPAAGKRKSSSAAADTANGSNNDLADAARKMRAKAKQSMAGADEFNLG